MLHRRIMGLFRSFPGAVLIGMLCFGNASVSANTLHIYNATLVPGQEAIVEMRIVPTPEIAGIQMRLLYDPNVMEAVDPNLSGREGFEAQGTLTEGRGSMVINYEPNRPAEGGKKGVIFVWSNAMAFRTSGLFVRLLFRAKDNVSSGAQTNLMLDPDFSFITVDGKAQAAPSAIVFHAPDDPFTPGLAGDVNRDGLINVADAVYALNIAVGSGPDPTPEQVVAGDVANHDGIVTVRDVTKLLQMAIGIAPG